MTSPGEKKDSENWDALKGLIMLITLAGLYYAACVPSAAQLEADRRAEQAWEDRKIGPPPGSWMPGHPDVINGRVIGPPGSDPPPGSWSPGSPDVINGRVR